ncbi:NAD(P)/FAD-dependent oxidoreductase [Aquimarina algiphila]|uniref:NAD(P)/FAD-dependent oxidoreductase n=1 Tax=Aquimarina algiphila TaxID=2047982 RepID=UPI002493C26C|nr:NAD(P)/FAD-dependent oxidoreductase [Aquimarina algiphila]
MGNRRKFIKQSLFASAVVMLPLPLSAFKKLDIMTKETKFDVLIIGGSYAGLSAAMALGRSLRNVLIIDAGSPCNEQTPYSHNFITQDGAAPASISAKAKEQVLEYPTVQFLKDFAVQGKKTKDSFEIITQSGQSFQGRKLVFATGIKDILPKIDGFAECWGITAVHCPYCHGYEVRKVKTGILANGDGAFETAKLISNWTDELSVYTNGKSELSEDQVNELNQNNIVVIEKPITSIEHTKGHIEKLKFSDGTAETLKALYARVPFEQHSVIPSKLGCQINEQGFIEVDMFQKTSVPGVFACGDNTTFIRSVAQAVYAGNLSGGVSNMEMIQEDWIGD